MSTDQLSQEVAQLSQQFRFLEAERRKDLGRISALEQRVIDQATELKLRDDRIASLEHSLQLAKQNRGKPNDDLLAQLQEWQHRLTVMEEDYHTVEDRTRLALSGLGLVEDNIRTMQYDTGQLSAEVQKWSEKATYAEHERNRKVSTIQNEFANHQTVLDGLNKESLLITQRSHELKVALGNLSEWRRELQQKQHEISEISRLDSERIQHRWKTFVADYEKSWTTHQMEITQYRSIMDKRNTAVLERLTELENHVEKLMQDRDSVWRIHLAQEAVLRQLPELWREQRQKAIENDPNRRRQPTVLSNQLE